MNPAPPSRLTRRQAIQLMLAASASLALMEWPVLAAAPVTAKGYGTDPDLLNNYSAGDLWPLTLTTAQRVTATALANVIIPAEGNSPAASAVHVVDFIDEWVSAPYPDQQSHRGIVGPGLDWLETESQARFGKAFPQLEPDQRHAICDDICFTPKAAPKFKKAAEFFAVFRNLTAGGYYSTKPGWAAIGYLGNVPLQQFDGPPPEVLKQLGLL